MQEKIKQEIGWYKAMFFVLSAVDASMIGWIVQNYDTVNWLIAIITYATIAIVSVGTIGIMRRISKCLLKLEEFKNE